MALEQGRDVFAIPHRVGFFTSSGTNELIKQGAVLVQGAKDIIDELNPEIKKYLQYAVKVAQLLKIVRRFLRSYNQKRCKKTFVS